MANTSDIFEDRSLSLGLARVSEAAALASAKLIGRGDEKAADQAAVNAMREQLNLLDIAGVVVIGEGELAIGPGYADNTVTLDMSVKERVAALAKAKGCTTDNITVCVLERPRHEQTIEDIRSTGAAIRLITDGDVAGVMHCAEAATTGIDMYMGEGGAPEGVLAAAALKCMGGQMYGRLLFRNDDERGRAAKAGITDLDRIYSRDDMVTRNVIFAATGVTDGSILQGIRREVGYLTAETILMRSKTGSVRRMIYRNPV